MNTTYESLAKKGYPDPIQLQDEAWVNFIQRMGQIEMVRQAFINGLSRCKVLVDALRWYANLEKDILPSDMSIATKALQSFPDKVDEDGWIKVRETRKCRICGRDMNLQYVCDDEHIY